MFKNNMQNKENTYYICHFCVLYKTRFKCDMKRHFNKSSRCTRCYSIDITRDEALTLSIKRKYIFNTPIENLWMNNYIDILHYFVDHVNVIDDNYTEIIKSKKHFEHIKRSQDASCDQSALSDRTDIHYSQSTEGLSDLNSSISRGIGENLVSKQMNLSENHSNHFPQRDASNESMGEEKLQKKQYICIYCNTIFETNSGLYKHMRKRETDVRKCENKRKQNLHIQNMKHKNIPIGSSTIPVSSQETGGSPTFIQTTIYNGDNVNVHMVIM